MESVKAEPWLKNFASRLLSQLEVKVNKKNRKKRGARTYIIPTSFGIYYGFLCFILLLVAIGYSNNFVYIITFFLISTGMTSLIVTNQNTSRVEVQAAFSEPLRANEHGFIQVSLQNKSRSRFARGIELGFSATKDSFVKAPPQKVKLQNAQMPPGTRQNLNIPWVPQLRGRQTLPRLILQSRFPFAMARAWKAYSELATVIVYPELKGQSELPTSAYQQDSQANSGIFNSFKIYNSGDSIRRIDWRASSRRRELLVRVYEDQQVAKYLFNWHSLPIEMNFEDKVSQLALWIDIAERNSFEYGLQYFSEKIAIASGAIHYEKCMDFLSLITEPKRSDWDKS